MFVSIEQFGLFFDFNLDGHYLIFKGSGFNGRQSAVVAFQREGVLLLPGNAVFYGDIL